MTNKNDVSTRCSFSFATFTTIFGGKAAIKLKNFTIAESWKTTIAGLEETWFDVNLVKYKINKYEPFQIMMVKLTNKLQIFAIKITSSDICNENSIQFLNDGLPFMMYYSLWVSLK